VEGNGQTGGGDVFSHLHRDAAARTNRLRETQDSYLQHDLALYLQHDLALDVSFNLNPKASSSPTGHSASPRTPSAPSETPYSLALKSPRHGTKRASTASVSKAAAQKSPGSAPAQTRQLFLKTSLRSGFSRKCTWALTFENLWQRQHRGDWEDWCSRTHLSWRRLPNATSSLSLALSSTQGVAGRGGGGVGGWV
jgi:hypothetical protein